MSERLTYLICSTPRAGASWLCEGLRATGVAGVPREYFMPAFQGAERLDVGFAGFEKSPWARERTLESFPFFLPAVLQELRTANGVFGASLQWNSFEALLEKIRLFTPYGANTPIRQLLSRHFGTLRFVFLTRRDRVLQAVSWALAHQTGRYTATQRTPLPGAQEPRFDASVIDALVQRIEESEAQWESLFDLLEVECLRLVYEEWCDDLPGTLERTLLWLGIDEPRSIGLQPLRSRRQSSAVNEEWANRYRKLRRLEAPPLRHP